MLNYVKSEIYRVLRTKSIYTISFLCLLFLLANLTLTWFLGLGDENFRYNNTEFIFGFAQNSISMLLLIVPFLVNSLFADEYQNGTFKNSVAYGVNRTVLYFGKLILSTIVSITICMIILFIFVASAEILLQNSGAVYRNDLLGDIWHSVPLFLAALTLSHMLSFTTKKASTHIFIYFSIVSLLPNILGMFYQVVAIPEAIFKLFPSHLIQMRYWQTTTEWLYCWGIFVLYFIVTSVIGLRIFSKCDV